MFENISLLTKSNLFLDKELTEAAILVNDFVCIKSFYFYLKKKSF